MFDCRGTIQSLAAGADQSLSRCCHHLNLRTLYVSKVVGAVSCGAFGGWGVMPVIACAVASPLALSACPSG